MGKAFIEMSGRRYGSLVVLALAKSSPAWSLLWLCQCDCGKKHEAHGQHLRSGHTKSCGCTARSVAAEKTKTHGERKTRLYNIWALMKSRTMNPNNKSYRDYGGRGIQVCDRWRTSFANFRDDMKPSYLAHVEKHSEKDTTIERKDVNGNYDPQNCAWATKAEQAKNKRPYTKH